jgi:hypothetical protein
MNWFDEWNKQVKNTAPLTVSVWSVEAQLSCSMISGVTPWEAMHSATARLSEVLNWHTLGTAFLCGYAEDQAGYAELPDESLYVWPTWWSIVAETPEQALRRFEDLQTLIDHIAIEDKWLPKLAPGIEIDANDFTESQKTFQPADLVTNFPLFSYWSNPEIDTVDSTEALKQISTRLEIQRLEIRTSTVLEAKRSLEALVNLLPLVEIDVYNWKWVIISAHNSLQNFMVAALEGTSPGRVLINSAGANSRQSSTEYDDSTLLKFNDLYDRVKKDPFMMQNMYSRKYQDPGNVGNSVKRLNDLRNDFTHFDPKTLVLGPESIVTLPRMLEDIFNVIQFLAFESHNVRWHVYPIEKIETKLLLADVREILDDLAEKYWKASNRLKLGLTVSRIRLASHRK